MSVPARGALVAMLTLAALAVPASGAGGRTVNLPRVLAAEIRDVKAHTSIPVLLPETLRLKVDRVYPSGGGRRTGWSLNLGLARGCGGGGACDYASFTAQRGERAHFRRRVRLRGGRTGFVSPAACAASCSPPAIEWRRGDVLYSIYADVGTERTAARELVKLANSAIGRGPR